MTAAKVRSTDIRSAVSQLVDVEEEVIANIKDVRRSARDMMDGVERIALPSALQPPAGKSDACTQTIQTPDSSGPPADGTALVLAEMREQLDMQVAMSRTLQYATKRMEGDALPRPQRNRHGCSQQPKVRKHRDQQ